MLLDQRALLGRDDLMSVIIFKFSNCSFPYQRLLEGLRYRNGEKMSTETLNDGAKGGHTHDVSKEQKKEGDEPAPGCLFIFSGTFWGDCFLKFLTHQQWKSHPPYNF